MIKRFCDTCGVELSEKTMAHYSVAPHDFRFTWGVFCKKCMPKAYQLEHEYLQKVEELKQLFIKKLKGGEKE